MFAGIGALGVFTASIAAYLIKFDRLDALRVRGMQRHVVDVGLGSTGALLTQAFQRDGYTGAGDRKKAEDNPRIDAAREVGAVVLVGDASRTEVLRRAGVERAAHIVIVAGADATNVEIAAAARALVHDSAASVSCSAQIEDPELWYALRSWDVGTQDRVRLEFFNVTELGARALLARYSPFAGGADAATVPPRVLIVGSGALGQHLIGHMVRQWQDVEGATRPPLPIALVGADVDRVTEDLHHRHPELRTLAAISPHAMDLRSTMFQRGAFLFDETGDCAITHGLSAREEGLAISTALLLLNHLRQHGVHVMVRTNREAGLAALLRAVGAEGSRGVSHLHVFSLLEQACRPEFVLRGTNEVLARALHRSPCCRRRSSRDPSAVPWDDLALDLSSRDRRAADQRCHQLRSSEDDIVPLTALEGDAFAFAPAEVERLRQDGARALGVRAPRPGLDARPPQSDTQDQSQSRVMGRTRRTGARDEQEFRASTAVLPESRGLYRAS